MAANGIAGHALLTAHPDLHGWMGRQVADRLTEARRLEAWPFLSWCFATRALVPELELLAGKTRGIHFTTWVRLHSSDTERAQAAARELGWCPEYVTRVAVNALALVCLTRAVTLDELTLADLDAVAATIEDSPLIPTAMRKHLRAKHHSLRMVCYQLAVIDSPPAHGNVRPVSLAERVADIAQPRIREVVTRYLRTIATTLRPKTVEGRAASLVGSLAGSPATTPRSTPWPSCDARISRRFSSSTPLGFPLAGSATASRSPCAITTAPSTTCGCSSTTSPPGAGPTARPASWCTVRTCLGCPPRCRAPWRQTSTPR
jgi:hypothetical protein